MRSVIVLTLPLVACVSVKAEMLVPPERYAPVPAESVRVFVSESELETRGLEWETVAMLFASGSADWTSEQGMLRKLRQEAGSRGANGIIMGTMENPNLGERLFFGSGAQRKSQIMAVRWWELPLALDSAVAGLEAFLNQVSRQQDVYRRAHEAYAANPRDLLIEFQPWLSLMVRTADANGFSATARDSRRRDVECFIFVGPVVPHQLRAGTTPGVVACERPEPPS